MILLFPQVLLFKEVKFHLIIILDRPNDFELVFCERGSKFSEVPINRRSHFTKDIYPVKDLAPSDYLKRIYNPDEKTGEKEGKDKSISSKQSPIFH